MTSLRLALMTIVKFQAVESGYGLYENLSFIAFELYLSIKKNSFVIGDDLF